MSSMTAHIDDGEGAEGWGEDAELVLGDGKPGDYDII